MCEENGLLLTSYFLCISIEIFISKLPCTGFSVDLSFSIGNLFDEKEFLQIIKFMLELFTLT